MLQSVLVANQPMLRACCSCGGVIMIGVMCKKYEVRIVCGSSLFAGKKLSAEILLVFLHQIANSRILADLIHKAELLHYST